MSVENQKTSVSESVYVASWFGHSLAIRSGDESLSYFEHEDDETSILPPLPDSDALLQCVYLPLEKLLTRSFTLPLSDPKLLEADMLAQELVELAGTTPSEWWLAWHAVKHDDGVCGMVFGLPQALRQAMMEDKMWKLCPQLRVDGWERLSSVKGDDIDTCAVIDADQEGVFIGYFKSGVWQGLRRLNWQWDDARVSDEDMAEQIVYSWSAMGFDADEDIVVGYAGSSLTSVLSAKTKHYEGVEEASLLDRHAANVRVFNQHKPKINFRRGRWSARSKVLSFKQWKRSAVLAAMVLVLWVGSLMVNISALESDADTYRANIESAFHRGLPAEKVMLDPLAQLKQAAQGRGGDEDAQYYFRQLQAISEMHQDANWRLRELDYKKGNIYLSGTAASLDVLNTLKDGLQQKVARSISLTDTDISGEEVSFRMRW